MGGDVAAFVMAYDVRDHVRIAFSWNGANGADFRDANQAFRCAAVDFVIENPGRAGLPIVRDLYLAEAAWAVEAWGAPDSFARLAELLLTRGGADELLTFARGLMSSFDTFGACHQMRLPPETLPVLLQRAEVLLAQAGDKTEAALLESARDLLAELRAGTATDSWVVLPPGTPVSNVRIVPRWRILAGTAVRRARRLFRLGGDT